MIKMIKGIFKNAKGFYQRGSRGWCDQAVWNIDDWLVSNLLPMFQKLKNERLAVPINMSEERWDNILSEIIHGLKCAKEVQDGNVGPSDPLTKHKVERAFNLVGRHLFDLWD